MNPATDSTLNDSQRIIADLQRRLAEASAERDEAVAQRTAIAEVLGVINSSPGDLAPVFDAMLEKAMRLCEADFGGLGTWQQDKFNWVADRGLPPSFAEYIKNNEQWVGPREGFVRVAEGDGYVQFADISVSKVYSTGDPYTVATLISAAPARH